MLDLERGAFIRPLQVGDASAIGPSTGLRCWAKDEPHQVLLDDQQRQCFTIDHTRCPALLRALATRPSGSWSDLGAAARVVAESCHLAEARLEIQAEGIGSLLDRVFGDAQ